MQALTTSNVAKRLDSKIAQQQVKKHAMRSEEMKENIKRPLDSKPWKKQERCGVQCHRLLYLISTFLVHDDTITTVSYHHDWTDRVRNWKSRRVESELFRGNMFHVVTDWRTIAVDDHCTRASLNYDVHLQDFWQAEEELRWCAASRWPPPEVRWNPQTGSDWIAQIIHIALVLILLKTRGSLNRESATSILRRSFFCPLIVIWNSFKCKASVWSLWPQMETWGMCW